MDLDYITGILAQLPIVAVFIWYSQKKDKEHREERTAFLSAMDRVSDSVTSLDNTTQSYHKEVEEWRHDIRRDRA